MSHTEISACELSRTLWSSARRAAVRQRGDAQRLPSPAGGPRAEQDRARDEEGGGQQSRVRREGPVKPRKGTLEPEQPSNQYLGRT